MNEKIKELKEIILENLANIVTLAGLYGAICNLVVVIFYPEYLRLMAIIAGGIIFSDWLDGKIAKDWLGRQSSFGAALDPLRDKVFVVPTLIILTSRYYWVIVQLPAKFVITTLGLIGLLMFIESILFVAWWAFLLAKKTQLKSIEWGKRKTFGEFMTSGFWLIILILEVKYKISVIQSLIYFFILSLTITDILAYVALKAYYQEYLAPKDEEKSPA